MESPISGSRRPLRAAIYCRCSTSDQRPDLQLDSLRGLASQRAWTVAGEFIDIGFSGLASKRPQLNEMLSQVGRGQIDVVAVWRLDRLGRSTRDLLNLVEDFRVRNVQLISAQENVDTQSPLGHAFITLVALLGQAEAEWLRERTRHGLAAARRRGAVLGRPRVAVDLVRAHELIREGQSVRRVAKLMGVGASTLSRALRSGAASPSISVIQPDAA
jgi:DNA invertase Pin-like site-specific DNA recombinase